MPTMTGLDLLVAEGFQTLRGETLGLLCNQASIASDYQHVLELLLDEPSLKLGTVFGPQHGLYGHTQDNMVEWEGSSDPRTGLVVHSLYGEHREPTSEMLSGIDLLLVDLPDVGARYYTFIWTLALCMKKCEELGIPVTVLDRPNPLGGLQVEGPVLDPAFSSFVGLYPLPVRHGMTVGEIANYLGRHYFPSLSLSIVPMQGWSRSDSFKDTGLPWAMPSPNMPTPDTAIVYPGGCLLEGTNLSEGRGTTRPFETFGAPYLDAWKFAHALNALELPGCRFRATQFEPTFQKHARTLCEGAFLHVTDPRSFEPVLAYVAVMQEAMKQAKGKFEWKQPPYEYETEKLPIDILVGNAWLRECVESLSPLPEVRQRFLQESSIFEPLRSESLLYPSS